MVLSSDLMRLSDIHIMIIGDLIQDQYLLGNVKRVSSDIAIRILENHS